MWYLIDIIGLSIMFFFFVEFGDSGWKEINLFIDSFIFIIYFYFVLYVFLIILSIVMFFVFVIKLKLFY